MLDRIFAKMFKEARKERGLLTYAYKLEMFIRSLWRDRDHLLEENESLRNEVEFLRQKVKEKEALEKENKALRLLLKELYGELNKKPGCIHIQHTQASDSNDEEPYDLYEFIDHKDNGEEEVVDNDVVEDAEPTAFSRKMNKKLEEVKQELKRWNINTYA